MRNLIRGPTSTNGGNAYALRDGDGICEKTLTPRTCGEGDGAKKGSALPEESFWTFAEVAIRSMVCGPNAHCTMSQDAGLSVQSRSEGMREGESAGFC